METELLLRLAGVGVLTWAVSAVLRQADRNELATLAAVAGVLAALLMVADAMSTLLARVQTIFGLF